MKIVYMTKGEIVGRDTMGRNTCEDCKSIKYIVRGSIYVKLKKL